MKLDALPILDGKRFFSQFCVCFDEGKKGVEGLLVSIVVFLKDIVTGNYILLMVGMLIVKYSLLYGRWCVLKIMKNGSSFWNS